MKKIIYVIFIIVFILVKKDVNQCEIVYILSNGECIINKNYSCYDKKYQYCSNSKEGNCRKCYDVYNLENRICI